MIWLFKINTETQKHEIEKKFPIKILLPVVATKVISSWLYVQQSFLECYWIFKTQFYIKAKSNITWYDILGQIKI